MRIELSGHQIDLTKALRDYVETKLDKLSRHFDHHLEARVVLSVEKLEHKADATLIAAGRTLHADAVAESMYAAIDLLIDKLDRLVLKHKEKLTDHHRGEAASRSASFG